MGTNGATLISHFVAIKFVTKGIAQTLGNFFWERDGYSILAVGLNIEGVL